MTVANLDETRKDSRTADGTHRDGAGLLEEHELRRYADAVVQSSLGVRAGETLIVVGHPEHRDFLIALADAGYRAGASAVDVQYDDPLITRSRLEFGNDAALGVVTPWQKRLARELIKPTCARVRVLGSGDPGYLAGIPLSRVMEDEAAMAKQLAFLNTTSLRVRRMVVDWPTTRWACQVYPELASEEAKRRLASDLLFFCRLTDRDGEDAGGWLKHVIRLAERAKRLTQLHLTELVLRGSGTDLRVSFPTGTQWHGGRIQTQLGVRLPNMPTEEVFTTPHARGTTGHFSCTFPLSFQGELIAGLRGEFSGGRLTRLDADSPSGRDRLAAHLDSDPHGNGRRLGEVALVDSGSRIGESGRTYFETLLDENAAAHIALGAGIGFTRATMPAVGINRSLVHVDVMIGNQELEVTGTTPTGDVALIRDGSWQI